MADESSGPVVDLARAVGGAVGRIVSAVSGGAPAAENPKLWKAQYLGSGTFVFTKPKRARRKRHQQLVKNRRPGMR